jgi:glycosyltransferase involved in cell wall biosynthesis
MNVIFSCGNAPGLPTGYGGQCLLAVKAFQAAGASKVFVIAWNLSPSQFTPMIPYTTEEVVSRNPSMAMIYNAAGAETVNWSSVYWFTNPYSSWPATIRKQHLNEMILKSEANFFVSLQDIFMFEPGPFKCLSAVWMPLHFIPIEHPTVLALADFDLQLPISGWGASILEPLQRQVKCARHIDVVAHGRCAKTYKPDFQNEKKKWKTRFTWGWPQDAFVVFLVASNSEESGRKAFDAQLQAFSILRRNVPHAWLHIHAEAVRAYDIPRLLETFGEVSSRAQWINEQDTRWRTHSEAPIRGKRVSMTPATSLNSISEEMMADMYRASDVVLAATCSEGCGVPILEAQLCGCPVVTTRATAMWEETLFGISVEPLQWIARMDFNSGWYLPHSKGVADALEEISTWNLKEREEKYDKIKARLISLYSNEAIIDQWCSVLNKVVKPALESEFTDEALQVSEERKDFLRITTKLREALIQFNKEGQESQNDFNHVKAIVEKEEIVSYIESL